MNRIFSTKWGAGQLFAFSAFDGETDYTDGMILRSAANGCVLELKAPEEGGIVWLDDAAPRSVEFGGDFFVAEVAGGIVRGAMIDTYHWLIEGACELWGVAPGYYFTRRGNRTLLGVKRHFRAEYLEADFEATLVARRQWLENLPLPELDELPFRALCKACSQLKTQLNSAQGGIRHRWTTPDRWPHKNLWLWDSVFHVVGLRHFDVAAARETLLAVFDNQAADGFVPHMATPSLFSHVTQPPVLAYGAAKLQEISPDRAFLLEVYERNGRFLDWIVKNRDCDGDGLVEWFFEQNEHCRCGESGMDNSPRFDASVEWNAPDFNAYLSLEFGHMAAFARELGRPDEAAAWARRQHTLNDLMNRYLWNAESGLYVDYDARNGVQSQALSSAGFLPLICGAPTPEMARRLLENLESPERFGGGLPVPSISRSAPEFYRKDMWRGPVWVNIDYLIFEGLEHYGFHAEAARLRRALLDEIERQFARYGTFFEFYDDRYECDPPALLRKGCCDPAMSPYHQVFMDYGWSATLYIDMVLSSGSCGGAADRSPASPDRKATDKR